MRVIRLGTFPFSLPQAKIRGVTSAFSGRMGVQTSVFSKQIQSLYLANSYDEKGKVHSCLVVRSHTRRVQRQFISAARCLLNFRLGSKFRRIYIGLGSISIHLYCIAECGFRCRFPANLWPGHTNFDTTAIEVSTMYLGFLFEDNPILKKSRRF